ncbi:uncharacterized protein LOC136039404 [Artemia franciscana]|uniref:Proteasome maturation protein n=1 Tax=Artemia franciscana TaxID=6661 RepID=A0AA88L804_ARTSF|nr:hypothetical protein QYM36_010488 [Artemia franciscana]
MLNEDGLTNKMDLGQPLAKDTLETVHPLQSNAFKGIHNEKQLRMQQLRRLYGVHIPISMMNEERATRNVGHLPILPRHNAMLDSLTGRDNGLCEFDVYGNERDIIVNPQELLEKLDDSKSDSFKF